MTTNSVSSCSSPLLAKEGALPALDESVGKSVEIVLSLLAAQNECISIPGSLLDKNVTVGSLIPLDNPLRNRVAACLERPLRDSFSPSFLEEVAHMPQGKTLKEGFYGQLFSLGLDQPRQLLPLMLRAMHKIDQSQPLSSEEKKGLPVQLFRVYQLLPLLGEEKVAQFPVVFSNEPNASLRLQKVWTTWFELFICLEKGSQAACDTMKAILLGAEKKDLQSPLPLQTLIQRHRAALSKDAVRFIQHFKLLLVFKKRMELIIPKIEENKESLVLLQALLLDMLGAATPFLSRMEQISGALSQSFFQQREKAEAQFAQKNYTPIPLFLGSTQVFLGQPDWVLWTLEQSSILFGVSRLNASALVEMSRYFCREAWQQLPTSLNASPGGLFEALKQQSLQSLPDPGLVLEEFWEASEKKEASSSQRKEQRATAVRSAPRVEPAAITEPRSSEESERESECANEGWRDQIAADLAAIEQRGFSPLAATLAQSIEERENPEVSDHFFLLSQGIDAFHSCLAQKKYQELSAVFRMILLDCHVALEQFFAARSPRSEIHDLGFLAKQSGLPLSAEQMDFLDSIRLATYWARYPACSENYFKDSPPEALSFLLQLSQGHLHPKILPFLSHLYRHTTEILFPEQIPVEQLVFSLDMHRLQESLSFQKCPPHKAAELGQIREMIESADVFSREEKEQALIHLKELSYYLSWLEEGASLASIFKEPQWEFWHFRNQSELDKLFKHLYATFSILEGGGDLRAHRLLSILDLLSEQARPKDGNLIRFLQKINRGICHHYHTRREDTAHGVVQCSVAAQGFSLPKKALLGPDHSAQALAFFDRELNRLHQAISQASSSLAGL